MQNFKGGKIIVADDICTHIEIIKSKMKEMNMEDYAEYYNNGQAVIDRVKQLTEESLKNAELFPICPVSILLLDFQMPLKNGLETVLELKAFFKKTA
jgi:CheY-like chemotaxis protein